MFQYSLRALFIVTILVALATWVLFVLPGQIGGIVMMMLFIVAGSALVAGTIYFRGYSQAFCIGCLTSHAVMMLSLLGGPIRYGFGGNFESKVILSLCSIVIMASGAAAMGMRYLAMRSQPAPAVPTVRHFNAPTTAPSSIPAENSSPDT